MTSWPCSASSAAATDESTPPDIATTIRTYLLTPTTHLACCPECLWFPRQPTKFLDQPWQDLDDAVDFFLGRVHSQAEAQRVLRAVGRKAHRAQDVRRFKRSRRTRRACRHGHAFQIE